MANTCFQERALADKTVLRYQHVAGQFLSACSRDGLAVGDVGAATVTAFLTAECKAKSNGWAKRVATALRSLLRSFYLEELIDVPLAQAVPTPAGWSGSSLPKALTTAELADLLAACDRRSPSGRRDYAVMLWRRGWACERVRSPGWAPIVAGHE